MIERLWWAPGIWPGSTHYSIIFYFTSVIKLFLSQPTSFTFFFLSFPPPHPTGSGRGKQLRGAELLTGVKP